MSRTRGEEEEVLVKMSETGALRMADGDSEKGRGGPCRMSNEWWSVSTHHWHSDLVLLELQAENEDLEIGGWVDGMATPGVRTMCTQVGFGWSEDEGVWRLWASSEVFMTESRSKSCGRCPSRRE
ncbi:hypothetical protein ACFX2I_019585 [Malus domestica]